MKKIITAIFTIALSFGSFAQTRADGCNTNTPGWGNSLGRVSFASDRTWTVFGNGITQVWSDAVTATACQKTTFNGGDFSTQNFNADCRSNPAFPGDLFSWCAVVRFRNQLCPAPWRVPTKQDFENLYNAFRNMSYEPCITARLARFGFDFGAPTTGGRMVMRTYISAYINSWGGVFSGFCFPDGTLRVGQVGGFYWSQSQHTADFGLGLLISSSDRVQETPLVFHGKSYGFSLRCVR